ncbi:MAG: hypothetical protein IIX48_03115 [Lachnospiraceae bacterium]|nr:hypothetical protein [Lachnospiraceae bacterium]
MENIVNNIVNHEKETGKKITDRTEKNAMKKLVICSIASIIICIVLLFLTSFIPQSALQKNMEKSADYYSDHQLFDHVTDFMFLSRQDNYADCILTNIIYHIDQSDLLHSVLQAAYYNPEDESVTESFSYAVSHKVNANVDYSRYWHGSMVMLRPLFVLFDITGVRLVLGIVILIMTVWFEILLFKNHYSYFGICYAFGLLMVSIWMCAFCIEYAMPFVIMSVELPPLFLLLTKSFNGFGKMPVQGPELVLWTVLSCAGIVTAFVDFLTAETITFTMAYVLYLIIKERFCQMKSLKEECLCFFKSGMIWFGSYAFMVLLKWMISLVILGKDAFFTALNQAALRMNGDATLGNVIGAETVSDFERISGALWRNIGCIFPFKDEMTLKATFLYVALIGIVVFCIWYLFRKKQESCLGKMLFAVSILPFFRFLVLNNHSYIHFFFTYRALLVGVVVLLYVTGGFLFDFLKKNEK